MTLPMAVLLAAAISIGFPYSYDCAPASAGLVRGGWSAVSLHVCRCGRYGARGLLHVAMSVRRVYVATAPLRTPPWFRPLRGACRSRLPGSEAIR